MHKLLITCILVFTPFEGSKAGEANLSMNLTGSIYPPPIWVDHIHKMEVEKQRILAMVP